MFAVITEVALKPGAVGDVAALFRETNPALVRDQPDWLGAEMFFDPEGPSVTVIARWRDAESYRAMANSTNFRETMQRFAVHFAGPPSVRVTERLLIMTPDDAKA